MGGGAWTAVAGVVIGSDVVVRGAVRDDLPGIVRIERESFADPWSAESFRTSLTTEHMRFRVVEDATGTLLGYVIAMVLGDEVDIANLAVASSARRRGIGGLLLDQSIAEAANDGVRVAYLEVRESNAAARALYESRSFLEVGRRRGYYRHPSEDALLLKRQLVPM